MKRVPTFVLAAAVALGVAALAGAAAADTLVTVGSPREPVLAEQAERACARDRREPPERPGGRRERQHRHGGVQRRRRHDLSVHAGRRRLRRLLLVRLRHSLDAADLHRAGAPAAAMGVPGPPIPAASRRSGRSARCPGTTRTGWSLTATPRWRSARSLARNGTSRGRTALGSTTPT